MSTFSVTFRERDAVRVLDLAGELDAHTAAEFEAAFERCLADGRVQLVVSGRELAYISSAGLGVFMAFVEPLRAAGGDLRIAALQPRVFNVFDLLGFPLLFEIVADEDEAVARFASAPDAPAPDASALFPDAG